MKILNTMKIRGAVRQEAKLKNVYTLKTIASAVLIYKNIGNHCYNEEFIFYKDGFPKWQNPPKALGKAARVLLIERDSMHELFIDGLKGLSVLREYEIQGEKIVIIQFNKRVFISHGGEIEGIGRDEGSTIPKTVLKYLKERN